MFEEQLRQHMIINTLKEGNDEIKCEIFENCKLLQNLFTIITTGSLNIIIEQMQEKSKQHLKRKDIKHMWWDVSINLLMKLTVLNILCFSLL